MWRDFSRLSIAQRASANDARGALRALSGTLRWIIVTVRTGRRSTELVASLHGWAPANKFLILEIP